MVQKGRVGCFIFLPTPIHPSTLSTHHALNVLGARETMANKHTKSHKLWQVV